MSQQVLSALATQISHSVLFVIADPQIPVEVQVCEIPLWLWLFHLVNAFHLQILFVTRVSHVFFITDFALPRILVIRPSLPTPLLHSILLIHCLALLFLTYTVTRKG